ncbi:MAG: PilN domain-containing protein, partial [Lentisphaerae bacterium]|nr:PilN domain-containing protein [Lentisphaerota bacterium]
EFTLHTTASLPSPPHGLALRTIKSAAALNLFPESWKIEISERKFRKYLKIGLAAAAAAWLLLTSWLYAWPAILDQNIKRLNAQVEKRAAQEEEVNDLRNRIKIIDTYSDRTYSPIEALLAVATSQPEGVDMTSFRYTGDKNHVLVEGKSAITTLVYNFMEELNQSGFFTDVRLVSGPTLNRALNVFVFELSLNFKPAESEEGARR